MPRAQTGRFPPCLQLRFSRVQFRARRWNLPGPSIQPSVELRASTGTKAPRTKLLVHSVTHLPSSIAGSGCSFRCPSQRLKKWPSSARSTGSVIERVQPAQGVVRRRPCRNDLAYSPFFSRFSQSDLTFARLTRFRSRCYQKACAFGCRSSAASRMTGAFRYVLPKRQIRVVRTHDE